MDRGEIESSIAVGAGRYATVHLDRPSWAPGYVRSISIHGGNRVQVAFDVEGLDEGGAYFWATYPSLDAIFSALETFFSRPLDEWPAPHLEHSVGPPVAPGFADHHAMAEAIRTGAIEFPQGSSFELQDSYWTQFLPKR